MDGSGRVWFAYAHLDAPNSTAGKVLELEFGLKTPQAPALPDAARDAPAAQNCALKLRRAR